MARAEGIIVGLGASWIKALTEPRLQSVAERIVPPSPAQKQEVGADPRGRPANMPPAVLADRAAVALGHGGAAVGGGPRRAQGPSAAARGGGDPLRLWRGARRCLFGPGETVASGQPGA